MRGTMKKLAFCIVWSMHIENIDGVETLEAVATGVGPLFDIESCL